MKRSLQILTLVLFIWVPSKNITAQCDIFAETTTCLFENQSITYSSEMDYNSVTVNAFNQVGNMNVPALIQNKTNSSADITFLESGNAEIVIRYFQNGTQVDICNKNIFVFDGSPISSLGMVSNFLDDQIACEAIDIEFDIFLNCSDCFQTWTLDGTPVNLNQEQLLLENAQFITSTLVIDSIGEYILCQHIFNADSTCYTEDCININIVEITESPSFSTEEEVQPTYCLGSEINFINETDSEIELTYKWTVQTDSLTWIYYSEDLSFAFNLPGEYSISLQYFYTKDPNCNSQIETTNITVTDAPIQQISCSSRLCSDNTITYRSPVICESYIWEIDETLGTIVEILDSSVTVLWHDVSDYTETTINLTLENCSQNICNEVVSDVSLFPTSINIYGDSNLCSSGVFDYSADFIPEAEYEWEINILESISGTPPKIKSIEDNNVTLEIFSFVGEFELNVVSSIESRACEASSSLSIKRFNILNDDNLCKEDLFKAELQPKIDQDILWTIRREDGTIFKQEVKSGLSSFLAFGFSSGGSYSLNASIPDIDFECLNDIYFNIINSPETDLIGPTDICIGEEYSYTLSNLGGNDIVEWTVFQNGTSSQYTAQSIDILWEEGGAPFIIKVNRSTEFSQGQICESEDLIMDVTAIIEQDITIDGPESSCYDAMTIHQVSIPGEYNWSISPPNIGTITEGNNSDLITIQWHYAPEIKSAKIIAESDICGTLKRAEKDILFPPFVPILMLPDTICQKDRVLFDISNLEYYSIIEFYVNGELISGFNGLSHTFTQEGWNDIDIIITNPNGCPQIVEHAYQIFVKSNPDFNILLSSPVKQCPLDSFQTVTATVELEEASYYYTWMLDENIIKEGFGSAALYSYDITINDVTDYNRLRLIITRPDGCQSSNVVLLDFKCPFSCYCDEEIEASIDTIIAHECTLVSFSGSIDFSAIQNPYWEISQGDSTTFIPILTEDDLTQDSILLSEGLGQANIIMKFDCNPVFQDGLQLPTCPTLGISESLDLFNPLIKYEFNCTESLNYDLDISELSSIVEVDNSNLYTFEWIINGQNYSGTSLLLEEVEGGLTMDIQVTQCTIDGSYCCSNNYQIIAPDRFEPEIILPNGSCENELWLVTLDEPKSNILSILWDFGDGSGSTLYETEKGYDNTEIQTISVLTTSTLGCTATSTLDVESFPNTIEGFISYTDAPCDSDADLTYIPLSKTEIISYEWNIPNAANSPTATISESGNYILKVTDIHGCSKNFTLENALVNESFSGDIIVDDINCGSTTAYINTSDDFFYTWYINGDSTIMGNSLLFSEVGTYDIIIVSTYNSTGNICDTLSKSIEVLSNPTLPLITLSKTFCKPLIAELSVSNYDEVLWMGDGIEETSNRFITSTPGIYLAQYIDPNGCSATSAINVPDENIDFSHLEDICIQACREDLDSLNFVIPGLSGSFTSWSWISLDSIGQEYTVTSSNGSVPDLKITDKMYQYITLQILTEDCVFDSPKIPLDIIQCTKVDEEDIDCDTVGIFSSQCGINVFDCVLSEVNGGPKLYYEGNISTSQPAFLCQDSLIAFSNNGHIEILNYEVTTTEDGILQITYQANIFIENQAIFEANETYIKFEFCDEEGNNSYCIDYNLPYRSCNTDFDCLIDCVGIFYGTNEYVYVNYCLNLSDVVQPNCTLESYYLTLAISNDNHSKIIYELNIEEENYDQLYCLDIPISIEDFTSGEYECLEMYVVGDCPDILCYDYQCGAFSPGFTNTQNQDNFRILNRNPYQLVSKNAREEINIYPNPNRGKMTISFNVLDNQDRLVVKNTLGKVIFTDFIQNLKMTLDISTYPEGVYFISKERNGTLLTTKKILKID